MTNNTYTMTATATCCGFPGTLAAIALHDCAIEENGGRCEDYPCCGHTDGGGCQTTPSMTADYYTEGPGREHLLCDHEQGDCQAEVDEPDDEAADIAFENAHPDMDCSPIYDGVDTQTWS